MITAVGAQAHGGYRGCDVGVSNPSMIGLSVAVGRFVEALFWAIMRVAGAVTVAVVAAVIALVMVWIVVGKLRRKPER